MSSRRRRRASLAGDLVRLTAIWVVIVVATFTMLAPLTFTSASGRDAVFNAFTGSLREMLLPWAVAIDVAGLILLPTAWVWVRRR